MHQGRHQVNATVTAVTGTSPERFGDLFRSSESTIFRAKSLFDLVRESSTATDARVDVSNDECHLDPAKLELDLASAKELWAKTIEPQVMAIYRSLVSKGYATRDFWT